MISTATAFTSHAERREEEPRAEGDERQNQHGDGEVSADDIGQPGHGSPRALRLFTSSTICCNSVPRPTLVAR
jgi:hypothetical protein